MDINSAPPATRELLRGRVIYLMICVVFLNLTYPFSERGTQENLIYVMGYIALLGLGVYTVSVTRERFLLSASVALVTMVSGALWIIGSENLAITLLTYGALIVFQIIILVALTEYIFSKRQVTGNVLFAAMTIYMLFGDIFTPLYMIVENLTRETMNTGAFMISAAPEVAVTWQKMVYYSFATLTTLGYGDISPVTSMAQALAALQAVIGVLYIAILVGRLVGLYSSEVDSER